MNSQQVNNYYHLTVNNFHVSVVQSYNDFGKTNVRKFWQNHIDLLLQAKISVLPTQ